MRVTGVRVKAVCVLPEGQGAVADLCLGQVREQGHLLGAGKVGLGSCPARLLLPCPPSLLFPPGRTCVSVHGAQRVHNGIFGFQILFYLISRDLFPVLTIAL